MCRKIVGESPHYLSGLGGDLARVLVDGNNAEPAYMNMKTNSRAFPSNNIPDCCQDEDVLELLQRRILI
jgi:hypothetical protein